MSDKKTEAIGAGTFDKQMAAQVHAEDDCLWYSVPCQEIEVRGLGFFKEDGQWNRLPAELMPVFKKERPALELLAGHMAGASLHFRTDSTFIRIRAELAEAPYMSHMTPAAQCGFDCYLQFSEGGRWRFAGVTKFPIEQKIISTQMADGLSGDMMQVCVNLPLYTGVRSMAIGLSLDARLLPPRGTACQPSIAFYGTSITQGGCASRSGMAYPAIIGRELDAEVYNMGFSGNGVGMPCLAEAFCRLPNLGVLVVDIEANAGPEGLLEQNLPLFLDEVRKQKEKLPVLVLSSPKQCMQAWKKELDGSRKAWISFQQAEVQRRAAQGDANIYFADAAVLIGDCMNEATVDGVHLTDLGFYMLAKELIPIIKRML